MLGERFNQRHLAIPTIIVIFGQQIYVQYVACTIIKAGSVCSFSPLSVSITGLAWGDVSTRDRTVVSSQEVYRRLLCYSPDPNFLKFDVLASVATKSDGSLDQDKLKNVIRVLRPDRDGKKFLAALFALLGSAYLKDAS
jgi:hypothetical protein